MPGVIDSDQHLYEPRGMWAEHIDPARRDEALELVDDDRGFTWVCWRGERLERADVHLPGNVQSNGDHRRDLRGGRRSSYIYDEVLPDNYWSPAARVRWLDDAGLDEAVCFPNFGLLWERRLSSSLTALTANMAAWNRWCASIVTESAGRLHPVAHLTLRDREWATAQLAELDRAGVQLAMVAPAPVDGKPMSHPDHDPLWAAFVEHGVTPVFHVADQPRMFDDCWYPHDEESFVPTIESAFIWVPPAIALSDMILNGVFDRHPELHVGVVELSSIWVPQFLLMLDGSLDFTSRLNGTDVTLSKRPSEYLLEHVRVSSFAYEDPARLTRKSGDVFMCCSDFPHSEGTASPLTDYERAGCDRTEQPGLFSDNIAVLLGR